MYVYTHKHTHTNTHTHIHTHTHTHTLGHHKSKRLAGFRRYTACALPPAENSDSWLTCNIYGAGCRPATRQSYGHTQRNRHTSAHCMFLTVVITKNILLVWMWQKVTPSTTKIGSAVNFLFACPGAWCLLT